MQGTRRLHSLYDKGLYVHLYIGSKCSNFIQMFIMHVHTVESHYLGRPGYGWNTARCTLSNQSIIISNSDKSFSWITRKYNYGTFAVIIRLILTDFILYISNICEMISPADFDIASVDCISETYMVHLPTENQKGPLSREQSWTIELHCTSQDFGLVHVWLLISRVWMNTVCECQIR